MMESARALREVIEKAKRKHTEKLCLVLRDNTSRASTLKTEYNQKQKTETIEKQIEERPRRERNST